MAKRTDQFQTIRAEGALLPPDILQSVASLKVDGVSPKSYHLPPGTKLNEAIAHSWNVLQKYWRGFQEAREQLDAGATGTEITNQLWLLPLFEELKYGRLTTVKSPQIDDRTYPIERFYADQPIHLIGCNLPLDRRTTGARGAATASPHSMMQEYLNRSEDGLWGFLSNGHVLRVLRDNVSLSRQAYVEFNLEAMMEGEVYADFALLWMLCHQSRIEAEKSSDFWLEKWSQLARDLGTRVLSELRTGVAKAIEALGRGFLAHPRNDRLREKLQSGQLSTQDFYRQILRIVYRLLFLFVAEDRELLHPTDADENACALYDKFYSARRLRDLADQIRGSKHTDLWQSLGLVFDALGRSSGCSELGLTPLGSFLWLRSSTPDLSAPSSKGNTPVENPALIKNDDLLTAVRALAYVVQDKVRRAVDYRNLGSEELGSVYESLLELHPLLNVPARTFELSIAAGNERKTTGSYYTPDSLVQCLLDSALDPVVEDRLKGKKGEAAEQAILDMKVCDPASGSGHFLIAAAHRMARHLARVRTGDSEPSPVDYQHALRDIIGRCIYGVDVNPMAVELCKVSLWMEALEPGKPLSFLDHHIQCGNSLLGTTPALLARGIPDDAFKPIEGDVKAVASDLKRDNKRERRERADTSGRQRVIFESQQLVTGLGNLPGEFTRLSSTSDDSVADVAEKERRYAELVSGADYQSARLLADTWCGVFVWQKDTSDLGKLCPTENDFRRIENNPHNILPHVQSEVRRLADQYQFFHWHLGFPDVFRLPGEGKAENEQTGWNRGFDVVLGNPPWERMKLQEKEWFAERIPAIANAKSATARRQLIAALQTEQPSLHGEFLNDRRSAEGHSHFVRNSRRYPLCGRGDVNTYTVFAELNFSIAGRSGRVGCIVPSGIATDDTTKVYFGHIVETGSLVSLYSFENEEFLFPAVHHSTKFCLLTLSGSAQVDRNAEFIFFARKVSDLGDLHRRFTLSRQDITRINPNTSTCPIFRNQGDSEIVKHVYRSIPILNATTSASEQEWNLTIRRVFDLNKPETLEMCVSEGGSSDGFAPMLEGKMIQQFDHRFGTYDGQTESQANQGKLPETPPSQHSDPHMQTMPRRWVPLTAVREAHVDGYDFNWLLGWRDITSTNLERTASAAVLPMAGTDFTLRIGFIDTISACVTLVATFNAFIFDYVTRQKLNGTHLSDYILRQLPVPNPPIANRGTEYIGPAACLATWLRPRVLELTYTAWDLEAFALDCGYAGPPFRWDEERRFLLRCELDAAYFHLYLGRPADWGMGNSEWPMGNRQVTNAERNSRQGPIPDSQFPNSQLLEMFPTPRDAVDYILETFPIVKRKDIKRTEIKNDKGEIIQEGTYITKDTILSIYDEMAAAIAPQTSSPSPTDEAELPVSLAAEERVAYRVVTANSYQTRLDPPPGPPVDEDGNFIPMAQWDESNWPPHIHSPRPACSLSNEEVSQ